MNFAGTPPQMQYGGIDLATTAPAATVVPRPIVTPERNVTLQPIHTSSSTMTSLSYPLGLLASVISATYKPIMRA